MPSFDTGQPITAEIDIPTGAVHLIASDRTDTVVAVRPSDPNRPRDVTGADKTLVEHASGRVIVRAPRPRGLAHMISGEGRYGSVEVVVELPTGSDVEVDALVGDIRADGQLGQTRVKTSAGHIRVDETGTARLETQAGTVTVARATDRADILAGGEVRITTVDGDLHVKNTNGRTSIGEVTGDVRVRSSNGDVTVDRARGQVAVKTANGDLRVGEVGRGNVELATGYGGIDVGIAADTAAWVDAQSGFGRVTNALEATDHPGDEQATAEVRARTSFGDIVIHRA